ncbi:taste receptor type 2 member 5 [Dasypus novemcinctus]|uniref:taste receptor type 2 member 5 n=1 Tax=Dasypus novemcinctus TaxID=9361 RepID=UPI000328F152|nr:taste receptor type 2 member 5 [Dasypus novemcinctus]
MLTAFQGLMMVAAVVEFLIGLVGNGFLIVWSFGEWTRKFRRSSYNLIVLGLAFCRFLLQLLIMVDFSLFPLYQTSSWLLYCNIFWVLVSQASLWFATFLSAFYCKKITTFEHPAYLWLKQRAWSLSLWGLLGYFVFSFFLTIHLNLQPHSLFLGNSSFLYPTSNWTYLYLLKFNSGSWLPFMLFIVFSEMLIVSLYKHHRKMRVYTTGRRDAQAMGHITALKSLGCFLILHIVYVLASPFSIISRSSSPNLNTFFISKTLMAAYPSLHSVILIMGNSRVKQICQRILQKIVCACRS